MRLLKAIVLTSALVSPSSAKPQEILEAFSAKGIFTVAAEPASAPHIGVMESWILTVQNRSGMPVDGATIAISGGMPAHGHGLPTAPEVIEAMGDGRYRIEGIKFNMMGHWVLDFTIEAGIDADTARLELDL